MTTTATEIGRLRALAELEILDSAAEATFDNVVTLATQLCETPVGLISLLDERRQWFKARVGLEPHELPRECAICDHLVTGSANYLEVPDAREDERFARNVLVTGDPHIVFYAGVALVTGEGHRLGALVVIDHQPRTLSEEQRTSLKALAAQVVVLLEARLAARRIASDRHRMRRLFEVSRLGMALVRDRDFVFEEVNEAYRSLIEPREYLNRPWREVYHDREYHEILAALTRVYDTGERFEQRARRVVTRGPEGEIERFIDLSADLITQHGSASRLILIQTLDVTRRVRDATALTAAHAQVAESRRRLMESLRAMPVSVALFEGPEHRYVFVNDVHGGLFGGRTDFVGRTVREAIPELSRTLLDVFDHVYQTGESYFGDELRQAFVQADGNSRDVVMKAWYQPTRDIDGHVNGIIATIFEVTELTRAREQLLETKRLLSAATEVAKVGFYEWRIPENLVVFNDQMKESWGIGAGVSLEEVMNQIVPEDRAEVTTKIERAMATGEPFFAQYRILNPRGEGHLWVEAKGQVTYDAAGEPLTFFGTSIDITSRKTVESDAQAVANSMPQLAWMADETGFIHWYNQRWYEFTGTSFEQMRGWGWQLVQHPDHLERVKAKFLEHLRSGEPYEDTYPLRRADGTYRWFLSRAVPLRDDARNILRWFGTNTDVTEDREAERQVTRLAAVIENSVDFVCLLDAEFRPTFLNVGGRRMTGAEAPRALLDIFAPGERELVTKTMLPVVRAAGLWAGETWLQHADQGREIPVLLTLFEVKEALAERAFAYAVIARDISERKASERSLEEAKDSAERANAAKSVFLANMSHEIRSPLGAIMGFADLIKNTDLSRDEVANYTAVIDRNSQHLLRIVDDILDLSKVEAGKMRIESIEFSLVDLLADFSSLMAYRARDKGIGFDLHLATPIPTCVVSDPTRLRQILVNVVGNAIKFTETGGVDVSVRFDDGTLEFTVVDTGVGLSAAQAQMLFQAFQQADVSTTRKYGGTGLGLVLTRRLAEALGGRFELRASEPDRGSTFVASVRVESCRELRMVHSTGAAPASPAAREAEVTKPLSGLRVLVIEDSPDNQTLFELVLTRLGAVVRIAADGVEGVAIAGAHDFDVILCDVQMPRMDGYEVTRALRARGDQRPIVALTAHAMKEERDRALRAGFTDFLSKPLQKDLLIETLTRLRRR